MDTQPKNEEKNNQNKTRNFSLSLIIVMLLATLFYRYIVFQKVDQSAMMFVGLPVFLAVLLSYTKPMKTRTGSIMKGITFFLLLLMILAIEGAICVLMAAPFFYAIGFIVGIFADRARVQREMDKLKFSTLAVLAVMSVEGVNEQLSFQRDEKITVTHQVPLNLADADKKLSDVPAFDFSKLPTYLKMGFPKPVEIHGAGMKVGDVWKIHFAGGEGKPGDLIAQVTEAKPGHYLVKCVKDSSHISHWLDWQDAEWTLTEISPFVTEVTLTMRYRRLLDPAWYFAPVEKYGVRLAGKYMLDTIYGNSVSHQ